MLLDNNEYIDVSVRCTLVGLQFIDLINLREIKYRKFVGQLLV